MDRLIYCFALAAVTGIRLLPLKVCFALGAAAGALMWLLLPGYRRLAAANMETAFGATPRGLVFSHFTTLGANLVCALRMASLSEEAINKCHRMENFERFMEVFDRKQGVVIAISHIGNWELFAQLCFLIRPTPSGAVYQPIRNRYLDDLINRNRRRRGVVTFDRRKGFNGAIRMLREGGVVGVLVDQHAGDGGIWMPFFSRLTPTSPLAATLAARAGSPIVPVAIYTEGFAKWRVVIREPVPTEPGGIPETTLRVNQALEAQISESPKDWFWVHNRWKIPHPQFLAAGARRGVFLPPGALEKLRPFRILVRSPNWLGDAVMAVPAVRAIKRGRPDARLHVLCPAKLADLWKSIDEVDGVVSIPKGASVFQVAAKIRGRHDAAVLLPNSTRSALEVWLAGIPRRTGYRGSFRSRLLNHAQKEPRRKELPGHHSEHYLYLARKLGALPEQLPAPSRPRRPTSVPLEIGVCPGAEYGPAKRWPAKRFREVMDAVSARMECRWTVFGVADDAPVAAEILEGFKGTARNLTGKTSLAELIQALGHTHLLLTNDTGTMHLAALLGVPTVALFGSTEPRLTGPMGEGHRIIRHQVECSPCFLRECPLDFRCMQAITAEEVAAAVLEFQNPV